MICSISVPPDVDPDTIELGWLNEDHIITDDSRVTIDTSVTYLNGSTLVTAIQFDPLAEEGEDDYLCYAIIKESFINESIYPQNIISKLVYLCKVRNTYGMPTFKTKMLCYVVMYSWLKGFTVK